MASESTMLLTRRTARGTTRCEFICPKCGVCSFDIHLEVTTTAKKIELATALVLKAHQLEHP